MLFALYLWVSCECKGSLLGEAGRCEATGERATGTVATVGPFEVVETVDPDRWDLKGGAVGRRSGMPFAYMNLLETLSWVLVKPGDSGGDSVAGLFVFLGVRSLPLA